MEKASKISFVFQKAFQCKRDEFLFNVKHWDKQKLSERWIWQLIVSTVRLLHYWFIRLSLFFEVSSKLDKEKQRKTKSVKSWYSENRFITRIQGYCFVDTLPVWVKGSVNETLSLLKVFLVLKRNFHIILFGSNTSGFTFRNLLKQKKNYWLHIEFNFGTTGGDGTLVNIFSSVDLFPDFVDYHFFIK